MKKEILELQKLMREEGMDIYYIPSSDFHSSEYMHPHFKCREFISGFTGSAGDLIVTGDAAYLWTDGRYFIQAEKQLAGSGIELMRMREDGVPTIPEFIAEIAKEHINTDKSKAVLGFDGRVVKNNFSYIVQDALGDVGLDYSDIDIIWEKDLAGDVWEDRPEFDTNGIWQLPIESTGACAEDKLEQIRRKMDEEEAEYLLLSDLTGIAWLLNLRGSDIAYTPVFYSFLLIGPEFVNLYLTKDAIRNDAEETIRRSIAEGVNLHIRRYEDIYDDVSALRISEYGTFMSENSISYALFNSIPDDVMCIHVADIVGNIKMIKNETEISCSKNAHIKDGVAVTKFIKWIKEEMRRGSEHTEIDAGDYLKEKRAEQEGFIELSFPTISAYGGNGAVVHYEPEENSCAIIRPEGFLLIDSGGQYTNGTTDVTRTIAVGPLTQEMKDNYTYVLKSHIAFADMRYREGMTGKELDEMLRKPLTDVGLNFNHGISHGVGHVLSVHEDAAAIRSSNELDAGIKPGMIMSDEPGVYIEGEYGIRTENLVLFIEGGNDWIINEPLTCVPYERDAINKDLLSETEIKWVDDYHSWVRETLSPLLDEETATFLYEETKAL